jgi:hypothetical protein
VNRSATLLGRKHLDRLPAKVASAIIRDPAQSSSVISLRMMAAGLRLAWNRCATACIPKCSARVPYTCICRLAMSAISCTGAATPNG